METPHIIVQVSAGSVEEARKIAHAVIERKLVACAQFFPIHSVYTWEGNVESDDEQLILMKTRRDVYSELEACIQDVHCYDVPEILAVPVVAGSQAYLSWIDEMVAPGTGQ